MNIDLPSLYRPDIQAQLDVGENKVNIGKPTLPFRVQYSLIRVGKVVVGNPDCPDRRIRCFEDIEVVAPRILAGKLVI